MDTRRSIVNVLGGLALFGLISCGSDGSSSQSNSDLDPCVTGNKDEVLKTGDINNPSYQNVMLAFMELNGQKVRYYFDRRNDANQIILKAKGPDFCGYLLVEVKEEDAISSKLRNNSGYSGAEVEKFEFVQDGDQAYWLQAGRIID